MSPENRKKEAILLDFVTNCQVKKQFRAKVRAFGLVSGLEFLRNHPATNLESLKTLEDFYNGPDFRG